mmetsp:Transcript_23335/g.46449  ORF Transcript_23335/g.46449 Transcript_23335/m.46449 type:complete len:226 (-) Transcript_23335:460-1137(-)
MGAPLGLHLVTHAVDGRHHDGDPSLGGGDLKEQVEGLADVVKVLVQRYHLAPVALAVPAVANVLGRDLALGGANDGRARGRDALGGVYKDVGVNTTGPDIPVRESFQVGVLLRPASQLVFELWRVLVDEVLDILGSIAVVAHPEGALVKVDAEDGEEQKEQAANNDDVQGVGDRGDEGVDDELKLREPLDHPKRPQDTERPEGLEAAALDRLGEAEDRDEHDGGI